MSAGFALIEPETETQFLITTTDGLRGPFGKCCFRRKTKLFRESKDFAENRDTWER